MQITGKLIRLRPVQEKDRERTIKWHNDPDLIKDVLGYRFPVTEKHEEDWYHQIFNHQNNKSVDYAIETLTENRHIGMIHLKQIDWVSRIAKFGVVIGDTQYHGKGCGKEACELMIHHAFEDLNLRKISLEVAKYNDKAIKLYEALGFQEEGLLKQHEYFEGVYHDIKIMSIFRSET